MATVIFTPAGDVDTAVGNLRSTVQGMLKGQGPILTGPNQNQLAKLEEEPSELYIVGHGNFGLGVGSHTTHYGGSSLARLLVAEGLDSAQQDLKIFVVACNSGVAMERQSGPGRRQPYVQRFAEALAKLNFVNTTVTGYGGFINENLYSSLRYSIRDGAVESTQQGGEDNPARTPIFARKVVYTITGGRATSARPAWKSKTSKGEMMIRKRGQ